MKKFVALPVAVLFALACTETTNPGSSADLDVALGKKTPVPNPTAPSVCPAGFSCATFEGFDVSAATEMGIQAAPVAIAPASQSFAGRWTTQTVSITPQNTGNIVMTFNLYIIGAWLGDLKKQPPHTWQMAYQCGSNAEVLLVDASFSNKLGNYQSFPQNVNVGHFGGQYSATNKGNLGYKGSGQTNYTTASGDVADATYAVQRSIPSCGAQARTVKFRGKNISSNVNEASWGLDNISVQ
jgi:hypothetical protein